LCIEQSVYLCRDLRTKSNEISIRSYILVVAPVTTPTVVREQCCYVDTNRIQQDIESPVATCGRAFFIFNEAAHGDGTQMRGIGRMTADLNF
jgi:hypothetical protein